MKPSVAESPEFRNWLKNQNENPEYDYKATRYQKEKTAQKNRQKFLNASVLLIVIIYFLLLAVIFI